VNSPTRPLPLRVGLLPTGTSGKRAAFSLLEVLIAMFILTVGMLGIAAVVVIGNASALRAMVADRVASVGRNALAEVRTREMLDAARWLNVDGSPVIANRDLPFPVAESFCIDPLYISAVIGQTGTVPPDLGRFPYNSTVLTMRRVSLHIAANPIQPQLVLGNRKLWERVFVAEDDLVFDAAALSRPRLLFRTDTGLTLPVPAVPGDTGGGNPLYPDYQGMYSWMVTVVPQVPGAPASAQKYLVSVVVFRNRNLLWRDDPTADLPGERVAVANFLGGGDVRLSVPTTAVGIADADDYLNVPAGQYLLLGGRATVGTNPPRFQNVFLWYRVIASGELSQVGNYYQREFTLAGPDWNPAWCAQADTDGDGIAQEAQAILCTNVYGVYTQVVEPDVLSRWSASSP